MGGPGCFSRIFSYGRSFASEEWEALLASVSRIALQENCYGVHWEVLDWNEKAIEMYKALGAKFRDQWRAVVLRDEGTAACCGERGELRRAWVFQI